MEFLPPWAAIRTRTWIVRLRIECSYQLSYDGLRMAAIPIRWFCFSVKKQASFVTRLRVTPPFLKYCFFCLAVKRKGISLTNVLTVLYWQLFPPPTIPKNNQQQRPDCQEYADTNCRQEITHLFRRPFLCLVCCLVCFPVSFVRTDHSNGIVPSSARSFGICRNRHHHYIFRRKRRSRSEHWKCRGGFR